MLSLMLYQTTHAYAMRRYTHANAYTTNNKQQTLHMHTPIRMPMPKPISMRKRV
jgi:hypothetical protein